MCHLNIYWCLYQSSQCLEIKSSDWVIKVWWVTLSVDIDTHVQAWTIFQIAAQEIQMKCLPKYLQDVHDANVGKNSDRLLRQLDLYSIQI